MARFGFKFKKVPISLSIDYSPVLGLDFAYGFNKGSDYLGDTEVSGKGTYVGFHRAGLWNTGLTFTYTF